jgi:hypothetical protein
MSERAHVCLSDTSCFELITVEIVPVGLFCHFNPPKEKDPCPDGHSCVLLSNCDPNVLKQFTLLFTFQGWNAS